MTNISDEETVVRKIQTNLAGIEVDIKLLRLRLKAGFSPNQPRVPAGNPNGGQWSDGGFSGDGQLGRGRSQGTSENGSAMQPTRQGLAGNTARITTQIGTRHSPESRQVRYAVTLPGQRRFSFQTDGNTQTVFDGSNRPISKAIWTPNGPQPLPTVQRVGAIGTQNIKDLRTGLKTAQETFEAARQLYNYLSATATNGLRACLAFTAKEFRLGGGIVPQLEYVGQLTRAETAAACTKLDLVQRFVDEALEEAKFAGPYLNAAVFGTAVHTRLRRKIQSLGDPTLKSEISLFKQLDDAPFDPSAVRADTIEDRNVGPICVYDLKTGKSGLSSKRTYEFARRLMYRGRPVIVIEIRGYE